MNKIKSTIEQAEKILIISHRNPDGDTLGAGCALINFLQTQGKQVQAYCHDPIPQGLLFIAGTKIYTNDLPDFEQFDLIITVDCASKRQAALESIEHINKPLVNVDHHETNPGYGNYNQVKGHASSTCEVLYDLFVEFKWPIDKIVASCLLTGILTDTENFQNKGTTASAIQSSAELIKKGALKNKIVQKLWKNKDLPTLQLWGKILARLKIHPQLQIATTVIKKEDLEDANLKKEHLEGLSDFLNKLHGVKAVLVLRHEADGFVKGSLRTTSDDIDVARIAQLLGGGGHSKAAGFTIKGEIEETEFGWKVV